MDASPDPAVRPTRHPAVPASALVARRAVPVVLALGLAVLALWQNVTHAPQTSFNQDESRWLHRAHYLREVLDPFGSTWDDRYLTRGQPPLGSYLMGAGLLLQGRDLATNGSWVYTCQEGRCRPAFAKWEENVAAGNLPSPADLTAGRRANAAIGALTVVVVFLLGRRLTNDVGGVAGAALLAIHPFQIYIASLATADALLGLLIALTALAAARFAERPRWPRAIVLGLLLGLGGATKLSPLLTALLLAGWGIAILGGERWRTPRSGGVRTTPDRLAIGLIAAPAIAWLVFVAVYPFLWPAPVERTIALFTFRAEEMAHQGADWPSLAVESRTEAFQRVGETLGVRGDALGRLLATPLARVGLTDDPPPLDLPLAVVGGLILVTLAVGRGWRSPTALVSIVLAGQGAITLAGMRSAFDRYHVPIALLVVVCLGVLAGQLSARIPAVAAIVRRSPATPHRFRSHLTPAQPGHLHAAPLGHKLVAGTGYGEFARNRHPSRSSTPPRG